MKFRSRKRRDGSRYVHPISDRESAHHTPRVHFRRISKTFFCRLGDAKVFLVDGEQVRNTLDIDFTLGSHYLVDDYIPSGEIWIEKSLSENEKQRIIAHEIAEIEIMSEGVSYEEAHKKANESERLVRESDEKTLSRDE